MSAGDAGDDLRPINRFILLLRIIANQNREPGKDKTRARACVLLWMLLRARGFSEGPPGGGGAACPPQPPVRGGFGQSPSWLVLRTPAAADWLPLAALCPVVLLLGVKGGMPRW
jgi:hypothetical protein